MPIVIPEEPFFVPPGPGNQVGTISIDANANMTIVASNGQSFGPYPLNLNENSGAIARTALNPSLVLNSVSYDAITGNINRNGNGGGKLHIAKGGPPDSDDADWSAGGAPEKLGTAGRY
jgi:hypothetical protein